MTDQKLSNGLVLADDAQETSFCVEDKKDGRNILHSREIAARESREAQGISSKLIIPTEV